MSILALNKTATPSAKEWLDAWIAQGAAGVVATQQRLTPAIAQALLERNPDNRNIRRRRVDVYVSDIAAGLWQANGEPIIVSSDGLLNDGQHRCQAVIETATAIDCLFVFGVDRESRKTTNQGAAKTASDFLGMDGIKNSALCAAIARMLVVYEKTGDLSNLNRISHAAAMARYDDEATEIDKSAVFATRHSLKLRGVIAGSPFGFCYHICRKINANAAENYFTSIATGEMLVAGEPAYAVRNRLAAVGKASQKTKVEIVLRGWNAYRRGQKRAMIKSTGALPDII